MTNHTPAPRHRPGAFHAPPGACDTHAHVISADTSRYPFTPGRSYTPPPAPEAAYLDMLDATGMSRGVLVQISVYGTDNTYLLEVLARHPRQLRGVAVVDPDVTDQQLQDMHTAGVRGLRINVLFGGGVGLETMETLAARIAPLGWHLQLLLDARHLPELTTRLTRLPVPVVIDHLGHMPANLGTRHPGFQALLRLLATGRAWVKLSGAYRIDHDPPGYPAAKRMAQAVLQQAPDRVVYGSDWPHTAVPQTPNTTHLTNLLPKWAPDPALLHKILVDNPARLYGFDQP